MSDIFSEVEDFFEIYDINIIKKSNNKHTVTYNVHGNPLGFELDFEHCVESIRNYLVSSGYEVCKAIVSGDDEGTVIITIEE